MTRLTELALGPIEPCRVCARPKPIGEWCPACDPGGLKTAAFFAGLVRDPAPVAVPASTALPGPDRVLCPTCHAFLFEYEPTTGGGGYTVRVRCRRCREVRAIPLTDSPPG